MAFEYKVGNFQLNTSTGSQSITGLGFQPKAVMFLHQPDTVSIGVPQIANFYHSVGMSDGVNSYGMWCFTPNGSAGLEDANFIHATHPIVGGNNGSTVWSAAMTSLDGDGFTINIGTAPPVGYWVGYLAFGGSDITNAAVGSFDASGSTGSQAITGLGFQPTALIVHTYGRNNAYTAGPTVISSNAYVRQSLGFSDGTLSRSSGFGLRDASIVVKINGAVQNSGTIISNPNAASPFSYHSQASLSSFDAGGFTINWTNAAGAGDKHMYLALAGPQAAVGTYNNPTSTGVFTGASGLGFDGGAVLYTTANITGYGVSKGFGAFANGPGADFSHGFASDAAEQFNIEATAQDYVTTSYCGHYSHEDYSQAKYQYNNRGVLQEQVAFDSFQTGGFDMNAGTVLGSGTSAVSYLYLEGAGGSGPGPGNPTGGTGGPDSPDSQFLQRFIDM